MTLSIVSPDRRHGEVSSSSIDVGQVVETGVQFVDWDVDRPLTSLAVQIGTPVPSGRNRPLVDSLAPRPREESRPRSLSGAFGMGSFPWHSEAAHWKVPPRYFLLRAVRLGVGDRPTLLLDRTELCLSAAQWQTASAAVWYTAGGRGVWLTPLLNKTLVPGEEIFRYDMAALEPASRTAGRVGEFLQRAICEAPNMSIQWKLGQAMLVDNWRMLHARGESAVPDRDRLLERVLIR
jgi:hypothetical protein